MKLSSDKQIIWSIFDVEILNKFWNRVNKTDTCWIWTGSIKSSGYGSFSPAKGFVGISPHRFSFALKNGKLPSGVTRHKCDNRSCINPDHLLEGTRKQNTEDMLQRGRKSVYKYHHDTCLHGHNLLEVGFYVNTVNGSRMCKACLRKSNRRQYNL